MQLKLTFAAAVDTWDVVKKIDLACLKSKVNELDIDH